MKSPPLEPRRFGDFERELRERAQAWVSSWGIADSERDFGRALLEIAAMFSSEVAEQLDHAGVKMSRGFFDWLAVRGDAARPASLPVVFKLADTARDPVLAPHPVKMQVDVGGANVVFETETDVCLVPGRLHLIVGVDPTNDAFFLPPPGLSSLDPVEPAPTRWRLKSFAAAGSTMLQLDPGAGLEQDMLVEIAGAQYRIATAKDDLASIEPAVPAGDGLPIGTEVAKVEAFDPFARGRNQQDHALYLGHTDLLYIDAEATIDVIGVASLGSEAVWEYWGKDSSAPSTDADPRWRPLTLAPADPSNPNTVVVIKPQGAVVPTTVGTAESRWIRARAAYVGGDVPSLQGDRIMLRINSGAQPSAVSIDRSKLPPVDAIVNSTPSATSNFYPLGREPRMFDSLYLGCAEAFSKKGAVANIQFDLAEASLVAMAGCDGGLVGNVLAGVDKTGALHLFRIEVNGALSRLSGREPLRPSAPNDSSSEEIRLTSAKFRPVMWTDGTDLLVAVVARNEIWLWRETRPFSFFSKWESWGSLPADADPDAVVDGLVGIDEGAGMRTLVALRKGVLWIRQAGVNPVWAPINVNLQPNEEIETIAPVNSATAGGLSDTLLAVASATTTLERTLYKIKSDGTPTELLRGVASDVVPFGIETAGGNLETVTVREEAPRRLWAWQTGNNTSVADLDTDISVSYTFIDGRIESGQLAAYCLATSTSGAPSLLTWVPFDPTLTDIVFRVASDAAVGLPSGPIVLFGNRAYLPGSNEGEILAANLGGQRRRLPAGAATFKSAMAVQHPAPVLSTNDTVMVPVGAGLEQATIVENLPTDGFDAFASTSFFWLDHWVDRDAASTDVFAYTTSNPTLMGRVLNPPTAPPSSSSFRLANVTGIGLNTILFVRKPAASGYDRVEVIALNRRRKVVKVQPPLTAPPGVDVPYCAPTTISARIFPSLKLDAANNAWDSALLRHRDLYFPGLQPLRQHAIAVADDPASATPPHPQWIALAASWTSGPPAPEFILDTAVTDWVLLRGDTTTNPALAWEYWNGTGWWRLDIDSDQTHNLKNSGLVTFKVPDDLEAVDWAGKTNYWVRARLIGGDYGTETVVVKTKTTGAGTTEQTIERSTEGIQPPYALDIWVVYSIDQPVLPTFLLTQDSGTLRDQSNANRTPGVQIEAFTPLIYTLQHFESGTAAGSSATYECIADCECPSGTATTSPAKQSTVPSPTATTPAPASRVRRRALYLGLASSKPSGEPINVLLLVTDEKAYDTLTPLNVDAFVGDRFIPVEVKDDTRAIGESGLVSMSLSVELVPAELFGRSLSWLRLTPGDGDIEWAPAIRGAYLNAVQARAAESMTRELVGSSEGAPNLTVRLARPPLLKDSLELRIREPLGQEERHLLIDGDPDSVKSNVTDLPGDWVLWRQVVDPADCDATARVYSLDEDTGIISFGDGQHGAIPPIGVDSIVAFNYERTESATAAGVPANLVSARMPLNLVTPVESVESAIAADQSAGGVAPETAGRVLQFGAARLRHRGRVVTARDFEDFALEQFPDVVQARCFVSGRRVRLVVVMRGADPKPTQAQRRELKRVLLAAAPSALAAPGALQVEGPIVRRVRIQLTLRVPTLDVAGGLADYAKKTLLAFFDTDTGAESGWALGASPREDDIAEALLDAPNLESIASVALSEIDVTGSEHPWSDTIRANELAMLADDGIGIDFEIAEAAA